MDGDVTGDDVDAKGLGVSTAVRARNAHRQSSTC